MESKDPDIQLRRSNWLTRAIRIYVDRAEMPPAPPEPLDAATYILWCHAQIRDMSLVHGASKLNQAFKGRGRTMFLDTLERQVQLVGGAGVQLGRQLDKRKTPLEAAIVLALAAGLLKEAETLYDVLDDLETEEISDNAITRAIRSPMASIGKELKKGLLSDDHPLLGRSFHRLLVYSDTRLVLQQARVLYSKGRIDKHDALTLISHTQLQKLYAIEAIIALSWADGTIDRMEERLVKTLISVGRFSRHEQKMLVRQLKGEPLEPDALAKVVTDPTERRFLLEKIIVTSLIDGELSPSEETFISDLAQAFEISSADLFGRQLAIIARMGTLSEMTQGLSWGGVLGRARRRTQHKVEALIRNNLKALKTEILETGDLVQLLAISTRRPLTDDEMTRAKTQLIDICKGIPSLAIVVAPIPGSGALLPLMIKLLPFNILPSSWTEEEEALWSKEQKPTDREN